MVKRDQHHHHHSYSNLIPRGRARAASEEEGPSTPQRGSNTFPPPLPGRPSQPSDGGGGGIYPTIHEVFPDEPSFLVPDPMAIPQKPKAKQQSNYRPPDQPLAHVPRQLHDPPGAVGQPNNYSETVHRRQESMPRTVSVTTKSVPLGKPTRGSLELDDPRATETHEAFKMPPAFPPSAPNLIPDDDTEANDMITPLQFKQNVLRHSMRKKAPSTATTNGIERGDGTRAKPLGARVRPHSEPRTSQTSNGSSSVQHPPLSTIPSIGSISSTTSADAPSGTLPEQAMQPNTSTSSRRRGYGSEPTLHASENNSSTNSSSSSNHSIMASPNSGRQTTGKRLRGHGKEPTLRSLESSGSHSPSHGPSSGNHTHATLPGVVASTSNEMFDQKQVRLATQASMSDSVRNEAAASSDALTEEWLERAKETACSLQDICRQGQEGDVDPEFLDYYLSMCKEDHSRISSNTMEGIDSQVVEKAFAVNDMLLVAIEKGKEFKENFERKPPPTRDDDSPAIASLVAKKDIFSLICMLRAQQDDQRLEAALALMNFARKAERDGASEEDRRLRNEILSSGGLHSILTLFRSRSSLFELKVVVALAVAYILPSFVMSSASLLKPGLGLKIVECLRFLSQARDVSPRGERITKQESYEAAAIGLVTFWVNQLEPMLKSQGVGLQTAGISDTVGRRPALGHRRARSMPGHVFDQRKEAIGMQELLEMTVSLIIEFASQNISDTREAEVDPVLLVEQICAVEVARPIAVREGVLKILVGWIERGRAVRYRLAAATSLRFLTSIQDKYMAGWIHSQMVNEGALPAIVRLTRDESLGPQVRLDVAQILSSLCVAPHTRAAVVESGCIHFLVDILFEHVTSKQVALFSSQALLQLAAGAITRSSALGGDAVQSNAYSAPDKRDKVVDDIVERGAIGSLTEIALQHSGQLRAVAIQSLRVLSEDVNPRRQTRLKLCDEGAGKAIGLMLTDILPPVEMSIRNERSASSENVLQIHEGLCALSNLLDPLTGTVNNSRSKNTRQVSNPRDPSQMLVAACIHVIESGGLDSLIRIALLPFKDPSAYGPGGISSLDLLAEACQSISFLSPLLLSKEVSVKKLTCWASDVFLTFDYLLHTLSQEESKGDEDAVIDVRVSALQGITALAEAAPLKIRIVDRLLPHLLEAKSSQDQKDISNASTQALQSLDLAEDEVAYQVAGNSASLLADWFCLQRSLLIQAMARREIRNLLWHTWEIPFREHSNATGPTKLIREVSDRSRSDDDKSTESYFFDNISSDDIRSTQIESILEQYNDMFGCEQPQGNHRALLDEKVATFANTAKGLLHSQMYPLNSTATETDWLLRHCDFVQSPPLQRTGLSDHVDKLLTVCFPSQLVRDHVLPIKSLHPTASFDFRALMMPQRRYFSFRREGQLLSRICGKDDDPEHVHWMLGFTNSSFAGEFADSLVQALYLCPMIGSLSFIRNHQWYSMKKSQEDNDANPDDGVSQIVTIVGSLPPSIMNLTFDGLLGEKEVRSLVKIFEQRGMNAATQQRQDSLDTDASTHAGDSHGQERFWCIAIRNCPHVSMETWGDFFGLFGRPGGGALPRQPLSSLKAIDLSGNGLNDSLCAKLLEVILDQDSGCAVEQLDLSRNRLADATQTIQVLRTFVQLHRADHVKGLKKRTQGWNTRLETLLLSSTGLHLGDAWLELVSLLKHNAFSLKRLDLSSNGIILKGNSSEMETFLASLEKNTCLVHLNLSENKLSSEAIDALITRLDQSTRRITLSFLDLDRNEPPLHTRQEDLLQKVLAKARSHLVQRLVTEKDESARLSTLQRSEFSISYAPDSATQDATSSYFTEADSYGNPPTSNNMITVLFSAPLVYKESNGRLKTFRSLDFDTERDLIMNCLKEASRDIVLNFDTANYHRILAAMAKGCRCLHYSGHGHEKYLPFEDEAGGPHWFEVDKIRNLMAGRNGGAPFRFVFVSACYSEEAGETFAAAGVPHVVCCRQTLEMKDTAAMAFTRQFYLALAVGHTVKESFEQGRKAVRASHDVTNGDTEVGKFLLLPADTNHDVPIFDAKPTLRWHQAPSIRRNRKKALKSDLAMFNKMQEDPSTSPPQNFLGRHVDMYLVLNLILQKRLVSITGEEGMGRSSLACALCHYINERASTMSLIHHIFYVKARQTRKQSRVRALVQKLLKKLLDAHMIDPEDAEAGPEVDTESLFDMICKRLREIKCLIVFDRTELIRDADETREFPMLLSSLFRETRHVRVLLTARESLGIPSIGGQVEHHYELSPLTFGSTVRLFAQLCPHLHTPEDRKIFYERLMNEDDGSGHTGDNGDNGDDNSSSDDETRESAPNYAELTTDVGMSERAREIFNYLGAGIPAKIEKRMYLMQKDEAMVLLSGQIPRMREEKGGGGGGGEVHDGQSMMGGGGEEMSVALSEASPLRPGEAEC